jgi:hypothetical protein
MKQSTIDSAENFTRYWCQLFVGENPKIEEAIQCFDEKASILIPNIPFRLNRAADAEEVSFSHLTDGRGHVHYWQGYNIGRTGESTIKCAKETLVLERKDSDSKWRIIHMHNSH